MQGVSAPALAGIGIADNRISTISALRNIRYQADAADRARLAQSPTTYASIMAYLLASNCVKPSGAAPFPTSDRAAFKGSLARRAVLPGQ